MTRTPRSGLRARATTVLTGLVGVYVLGIVALIALVHALADEWWAATLLLFAPRWVWALPLLVLAPAALLLRRRLLAPLALAAALWATLLLGFNVPLRSPIPSESGRPDLRVMTYNVGGVRVRPEAVLALIQEVDADVVALQECNDNQVDEGAAKRAGWHVNVEKGLCLLSRHPIRKVDPRDPRDMWAKNGSGAIVRYEIEAPGRALHLLNVHLETVRDGLDAILAEKWRGVPELEANMRQRALESRIAREWATRASGPLVVVGDFNMPVESAIYRDYWSSFTNAFSEAGFGLGATKETRWHGIRIDHVLFGRGWDCRRAWVGPHLGGDHRPMVADLVWGGE